MRSHIMRMKVILLTFIFLFAGSMVVVAQGTITAKIPVSCQMGDPSAEYNYRIESVEADAPLPDRESFSLRDSQSGAFVIKCDTPGTWHYRITQDPAGTDNYSEKPYNIMLFVGSHDDGTLFLECSYYREGSTSKSTGCDFISKDQGTGGGGLIQTPESEPESESETITPVGGGGGGLTWTPEPQEETNEAETALPEEESEALSEPEQKASEAPGTAGKPQKGKKNKDSDNKRDKEKGKKEKEEEKKEKDYGRGVYGEDRQRERENGVRGEDRERQSEGSGASYGLLGDFLGSPRTGDETDLLLYVLLLFLAGGGALVITVYLWHRKKRVE